MWMRWAWMVGALGTLGLLVSSGLGPAASINDAMADVLAAEALLQEGLLDDAERRVRRALRRSPGLAAAHHLVGRIRLAEHRLVEAEAAFSEAARLLRAQGGGSARTSLMVVALDLARVRAARLGSPRVDESLPSVRTAADTRRG